MSACHSVVCCAHGSPCIMGNFQAAFEGLRLSKLDRRRRETDNQSDNSETADTAYSRSSTARSTTVSTRTAATNVSSIYENQCVRKRHSSSSKRANREEKSGERAGPAIKEYIGIKSSDEAERIVTRATDFKMYHKLSGGRDIDALQPTLPLYIVYRSTKNAARHIPIKTSITNNRRFFSAGMNVDNKRLLFESIDALVKYYKTYVQLQPQNKSGMVDVFPA